MKAAILLLALAGCSKPPEVSNLPDVPGLVRTSDARLICSTGTKQLRHWSRERDNRVLRRAGLPTGPHPDYEIDHLIPLGIGGADDEANLWAQKRKGEWGAEKKDKLEWKMRDLICNHGFDPPALQMAIAHDWIEAYERYMK